MRGILPNFTGLRGGLAQVRRMSCGKYFFLGWCPSGAHFLGLFLS